MSNLTNLECELGELLIVNLNLEDIKLEDIDSEAALFNEGLGLDSIDALELGMLLSTKYGIKLQSDDPGFARIFSSLRTLAKYVESNRTS
ncbi:MAG: phosphopantetheine-binding protein [Gammaproteobacteria bacterium]|nr:phosphopantetheine-binding protein [Gammaproteobacteria bacterium]